ncbi:hypothetical protein O1M54_06515 [Streptomyces diastatochromogenes]|nr:hypothetical protein [Streptomyces diastatochromogenes]
MLREAYERAGVDPAQVQYVELHGTGTPVGDPIEAAALGAVLGGDRAGGAPLRVGSVKTNIGHLEGAAGITGLVKTVLAVSRRALPPSLNFATPNPAVPLADLGLEVQRDLSAWPVPDRPLIAGVSSFGMGGTNAHVVLQEAPATTPETAEQPAESGAALRPWLVSARGDDALRAQAGRLRTAVEGGTARVPWTSAGRWPRPGRPSRTAPSSSAPTGTPCWPGSTRSAQVRPRPTSSPEPSGPAGPRCCSPGRAPSASAWAANCAPPSRSSPPPSTRCAPYWIRCWTARSPR